MLSSNIMCIVDEKVRESIIKVSDNIIKNAAIIDRVKISVWQDKLELTTYQ